ncbi:MAG TPA: molybdopterin-guanine dinucleotide biosynthesis protein B [bacterium]|nr:molybdopterin-guanine dinucleotide biosynthesis protein B [bacterium]
MSRLEDAVERLLAATTPLPLESVPIWEADGRVAAADVDAPGPVPHFPRPAMDGYVCHDADLRDASPGRPAILRITGAVRMGDLPGRGPGPGEAWSITTGAPLPERGDRILPVEAVRLAGDQVRVEQPPSGKTHIVTAGEAIREGAPLIRRGEVIRPAGAGALAACGVGTVRVHRRPRIALVSTGDELVDVTEAAAPLPRGRVFNSNAVTLGGLLRTLGCEVQYRGIVRDAPEELRAAFAALRDEFDVVLSTGGVSIGRHDAVHRTWLDLGAQRIVGRVDLKPGGPFFAGRLRDSWGVGLSGTPVACLAAFHLLVRPFFARLAGQRHAVRPLQQVTLADAIGRPTDRMRALWARTHPAESGRTMATVLDGDDVGDFASLLHATALVLIPPGSPPLPAGSRVTALLLDREEDRDRLVVTPPRPGPLVIGVVGESGSGKTTVIVDVVRRLAEDGIRVAAVKHAAHGFDLDREGSDSARVAGAGAALVVLAGPTETVLRITAPLRSPDHAAGLATLVAEQIWGELPALVLVEGFQHPSGPVITVGPQKPGAAAGEVLAAVLAVNGVNGQRLETELQRVSEAVRSRVRAGQAEWPR